MAENPASEPDSINKQQFWKFHINNWHQSKMSQTAYCRKHGLTLHRFIYWKKALNRQDSAISFVPVPVSPNLPVAIEASNLNLFTANGYRIEVSTGFDPTTLKQLIHTVQSL